MWMRMSKCKQLSYLRPHQVKKGCGRVWQRCRHKPPTSPTPTPMARRYRSLPPHAPADARASGLADIRQAIDRLASAIGPTHMLARGAMRHLAVLSIAAKQSPTRAPPSVRSP